MSLAIGLQHRDQLPDVVGEELEQLVSALQSAVAQREAGSDVSLLFGLQFREQLPPIVADELDQLTAAISTAFNRNVWVKTQQSGELLIPTSAASASVSISPSVDPSNTVLTWLGQSTDTGLSTDEYSPCFYETRIELSTNGQSLTATRGTSSGTYKATTAWGLMEFYPGLLRSVQRGTIAMGAVSTTKTATIRPVVTDRARVELLGYTTPYTDGGVAANREASDTHKVRLKLTNSTTVTATVNTVGGEVTVAYQVVEYF